MASYTATIDSKARSGEIGQQILASGYYDLTGAITGHASTGDTITYRLIPQDGAKVVGFWASFPELDTNATPTGTLKIGNSDDDDGYLTTTNIGLPAQLPANGMPINLIGNGALIGTTVRNRDIVINFNAALATSVTSGRIRIGVIIEGL